MGLSHKELRVAVRLALRRALSSHDQTITGTQSYASPARFPRRRIIIIPAAPAKSRAIVDGSGIAAGVPSTGVLKLIVKLETPVPPEFIPIQYWPAASEPLFPSEAMKLSALLSVAVPRLLQPPAPKEKI